MANTQLRDVTMSQWDNKELEEPARLVASFIQLVKINLSSPPAKGQLLISWGLSSIRRKKAWHTETSAPKKNTPKCDSIQASTLDGMDLILLIVVACLACLIAVITLVVAVYVIACEYYQLRFHYLKPQRSSIVNKSSGHSSSTMLLSSLRSSVRKTTETGSSSKAIILPVDKGPTDLELPNHNDPTQAQALTANWWDLVCHDGKRLVSQMHKHCTCLRWTTNMWTDHGEQFFKNISR